MKIKLEHVYLRRAGVRQGLTIWIVDGSQIRREVFDEFLQGGNDQRYRFVPENEIWIDEATSAEEMEYALEHELFERQLMKKKAFSYDRAHNEALVVERALRLRNEKASLLHELSLPPLPPADASGTQLIRELGDKVELREIYRAKISVQRGLSIWIVDGAVIRRDVFPDFNFSGNGLEYRFVPDDEIWIDNHADCLELDYQIAHQMAMSRILKRGGRVDSAYGAGYAAQTALRKRDAAQARRKEQSTAPVDDGVRERGTG
jgi:hypothetical protein